MPNITYLPTLLYSPDTNTAIFMNQVIICGFAVECAGRPQSYRGVVERNIDGELTI